MGLDNLFSPAHKLELEANGGLGKSVTNTDPREGAFWGG